MEVSRSRTVGQFTYSIFIDTDSWMGEVTFSGFDKDDLTEGVVVDSSKEYITVEAWRCANTTVTVFFSLDHGGSKKGQINIIQPADSTELIHSVTPRPEAIGIGLEFIEGENVLHEVDELYGSSYPSVVSDFTSEVRYIFDFESHTAIMNQICRFDNGEMRYRIHDTAPQYFKNMMLGRNKFIIESGQELRDKLALYNSFEHLPTVEFETVREQYLNWWESDEFDTDPSDFGFERDATQDESPHLS